MLRAPEGGSGKFLKYRLQMLQSELFCCPSDIIVE